MGDASMDFGGPMGSTDASGHDMMEWEAWMAHQPGVEATMQALYNDFPVDKAALLANSDRLNVFNILGVQSAVPSKAEREQPTQPHDQNSSQWREQHPRTSNPADSQSDSRGSIMSWDFVYHNDAGNFVTDPSVPKDDDAASCDSFCEGSCPSQCGETGHGVVCDDDECVPPGLCRDQECISATRPCTDEDCVDEMCSGEACERNACKGEACQLEAPPVQQLPSDPITDTDKVAATVLANIADEQLPSLQTMPQMSHMGQVSPDVGYQGHLSAPDTLSEFSMGMQFPNMDYVNSLWPPAPEQDLVSHILQYHDPNHALNHVRPCVADNPSQFGSRCSLPLFYPNNDSNMNGNAFPSQANYGCGFVFQDPARFEDHIFQHHRGFLQNDAYRLGQSMQPNAATMTYGPQFNNGFGSYQMNMPMASAQTSSRSMPPSPFTNLSWGTTANTTPTSAITPPSDEEPTLRVPDTQTAIKTEDHRVHSLAKSPSHLDGLVCRWIQPGATATCGQKFETQKDLHEHCKECHLATVQKLDGGFSCLWAECSRKKNFPQKSKLDRHMQTHTAHKPVQCEICLQWLSAPQALVQHMRTHTGDEPWRCTWEGCNSTFKQQSALTMHYRAHTGEKPLECEVCHKRFSESSNLSKHRRIHKLKGQQVCGICGKDFHRLDQLRRHLSTNHKDQCVEVSKLLCKAKEEGRDRGRGIGRSVVKSEELA